MLVLTPENILVIEINFLNPRLFFISDIHCINDMLVIKTLYAIPDDVLISCIFSTYLKMYNIQYIHIKKEFRFAYPLVPSETLSGGTTYRPYRL